MAVEWTIMIEGRNEFGDVYDRLAEAKRAGGPLALADCWTHLRCKFYELHVSGFSQVGQATYLTHHRHLCENAVQMEPIGKIHEIA